MLFGQRGWTVESIRHDYGEDLLVRVFEGGKATPFIFFVQVKAYSSIESLFIRKRKYLSVPVEAEHLESWRDFREPVVLAVWDWSSNRAYWQTVQTASSVAERRSKWRRKVVPKARIWVPSENLLNDDGLSRIALRARSAWEILQRERDGAKSLIDALQEQLGLQILYDPQYGTLIIPEGKFVPDLQSGHHVYLFGRAARDIDRIANALGLPKQQAFEIMTGSFLQALQTVESGQPATIRAPNGQIIDVWQSIEDAGEDFLRSLEQSDED